MGSSLPASLTSDNGGSLLPLHPFRLAACTVVWRSASLLECIFEASHEAFEVSEAAIAW